MLTFSFSNSHLALIIGIVSALSATILILSIVTYLCCTRHRAKSRRAPYGFAAGIRPSSRGDSIESWRKNAVEASPITPLTAKTASPKAKQALNRSPLPVYPDYLPYRGPVEPPRLLDEQDETSRFGMANPSAHGWMREHGSLLEADFTPSFGSPETNHSLGRLLPLPVHLDRERFDDIALDNYNFSDTDNINSSASTPSSLDMTGMTARAPGATRSIARLWPSRDAVPSALQPIAVNIRSDSMVFAPSYTTAGNLSSSPSQLIGSGLATRSTSNSHSRPSTHSSSQLSSQYTLRRGVSVKSVKTMRSFFSGLLLQNSSTPPAGQTRALPQAAARPDSGIFPVGIHWSNNSSAGTGIQSRRQVSPSLRLEGGPEHSPNMFIELNPNSPMTAAPSSRPESEWTQWRSGWTTEA